MKIKNTIYNTSVYSEMAAVKRIVEQMNAHEVVHAVATEILGDNSISLNALDLVDEMTSRDFDCDIRCLDGRVHVSFYNDPAFQNGNEVSSSSYGRMPETMFRAALLAWRRHRILQRLGVEFEW